MKRLSFADAQCYAEKFLSVLTACEAKVICTVTPSIVFSSRVSEGNLERMHMQDLMQRLEMETKQRSGAAGLTLLFVDRMSSYDQQTDLQQLYTDLRSGADPFLNFDHIKDTISFTDSARCCGIQLADFVAGAFNGFLRGYESSEKMFALRVYSQVRKSARQGHLGYGIIEVPKSPSGRQHLQKKFKADFINSKIAANDDIPF